MKVGALALASATKVPLVPISANCYPAIVERRKWDVARNPLPFARVAVVMGEPHMAGPLNEVSEIEQESHVLQSALNDLSVQSRSTVGR